MTDEGGLLSGPRTDTVLAFDPGVAHLGIGVLEFATGSGPLEISVTHHEQFNTPPDIGMERRLDAVALRIAWAFETFQPSVVGWENVVAVSAGKDASGGASSNGGRIKEVSGMIRFACLVRHIPSHILMPATYRKMAFGKGKSRGKTKKDMRGVIEQFLNVLHLTFDESEALAMALCTYSKWKGNK